MKNYYWGVVILIVLLLAFYLFSRARSGKKEKVRGRRVRDRRAPSAVPSSAALPPHQGSGVRQEEPEDEEEEDEEEEQEAQDAADRLFRRVHRQMAAGMTAENFQQAAGPDARGFVYPMLVQLYNKAKDEGRDPLRSVTVADYRQVLKDEI